MKTKVRRDKLPVRSQHRPWRTISLICFAVCSVLITFQLYRVFSKTKSSIEIIKEEDHRTAINQLIEKANIYAPQSIVEINTIESSLSTNKNDKIFIMPPSKPVLCVVFQSCSATGLAMFFNNTRDAHSACDWAIQCYNEIPTGFSQFLCARLQQLGVHVVYCSFTLREQIIQNFIEQNSISGQTGLQTSTTQEDLLHSLLSNGNFNNKIIPKPLLYLQIQHLLSSYKYIWLLDEDISFNSFDANGFIDTVKCSYYPYPVPLVSQPLIAGSTQAYKYLNKKTWNTYVETYPDQDILTIGTGFIEIQAPFLHAGFFNWYLDSFVKPILLSSHILGADWGFDCLLCSSATYYAIHKLKWEFHDEPVDKARLVPKWKLSRLISSVVKSLRGLLNPELRQVELEAAAVKNDLYSSDTKVVTDTPVCALVVKNAPLHHLNNHMMDRIIGRQSKIRLNRALMIILKRVFPEFYQTGGSPLSSPLSGAIKYKAKTGDLDSKCLGA